MRLVLLFCLSAWFSFAIAQKDTLYTPAGYLNIKDNPDSVQYSKDYFFNEGIYLDYSDFRTGNAIPRSYILTKVEKISSSFITNFLMNQILWFFEWEVE
jgi:hypothetical protein